MVAVHDRLPPASTDRLPPPRLARRRRGVGTGRRAGTRAAARWAPVGLVGAHPHAAGRRRARHRRPRLPRTLRLLGWRGRRPPARDAADARAAPAPAPRAQPLLPVEPGVARPAADRPRRPGMPGDGHPGRRPRPRRPRQHLGPDPPRPRRRLAGASATASATGSSDGGPSVARRSSGSPPTRRSSSTTARHGRRGRTRCATRTHRPCARHARDHPDEVAFHAWLQWHLERQVDAVSDSIGLFTDLAVGVHPAGADAWCYPGLIATGARIGAPPDVFNASGQDWGLAPFDPGALRAAAYAPFLDALRCDPAPRQRDPHRPHHGHVPTLRRPAAPARAGSRSMK